MNKKKGIVLGVCAVVVVLVGYLVYFGYNKYQESLIFREGEKIGDMDVLEGEVDTKLYTSGDYQVVEKTMKDYIVEYVDVTREIVNRLSDEKFTNLLTYENVEQDGKEFTETLNYLNEQKTELQEGFDRVIAMSSDVEVMKAIEDKNIGTKYENLYREVMLDSSLSDALKDEQTTLIETRDDMMNFIDQYIEVFEFLKEHQNDYVLENGQILFQNESLLNQYQSYLKVLIRLKFLF